MLMSRRPVMQMLMIAVGVIGITMIVAGARLAHAADDYPDKPIQIIVAYAAGGGTDRLARVLAGPLEKILGQPIVVQNLPGGGGQVAAAAVLREDPDGYSILATNQPDLNMATLSDGAPYKVDDFQVIMVDLVDPRILLVKKDSPLKTFDDFVQKAKAEPGKLTVSVTQGGAQEQFAKWLFAKLGLDVRLVGYKGGSVAANAMIGDQVDATVGDDSARFNIREKAHALLLGAPKKSPRWPEAPTLVEALKKYDVTPPTPDFLARYGVYAVPSAFKEKYPERYKKLQDALLKAREDSAFQELIAKAKIDDLSIGEPGEGYSDAFKKGTEAVKSVSK